MQGLLLKRAMRDLRSNAVRYGALTLLVVLAVFLVLAVLASSIILTNIVEKAAQDTNLEDGEFGTFVALTDDELAELRALGAQIEPQFSLDYIQSDDSIVRVMGVRSDINKIGFYEGGEPTADDEIVVERIYADAHGLSVGDTLEVAGHTFTISGIGYASDYDFVADNPGDLNSDGDTFGTLFVTPAMFEQLESEGNAIRTEAYRYAFTLDEGTSASQLKHTLQDWKVDVVSVDDPVFVRHMVEQAGGGQGGFLALMAGGDDARFANLTDFVEADENPRIKASAADMEVSISVGWFAGVLVLMMITYVLSVFVAHTVERDSEIIGALYALGISRKQMMFTYTMAPVLACLLGGIIGTIIGFSPPAMDMIIEDTTIYYSVPPMEYGVVWYLVLYGVLMPPLVAAIINWLMLRRKLGQSALSLLRRDDARLKVSKIKLEGTNFVRTFRIRQLLREKRSAIAVLAGMAISLLLMFMSFNTFSLCNNLKERSVADTRYEYMYTLKYPPAEVPEGGHAAYVETLKRESMGYTWDIAVMGIEHDNPFFDEFHAQGTDEVSISEAMATRYGVGAGDELTLYDHTNDKSYAFTVREVVPYFASFAVFMDIDDMRDLFGQDDDYFNVVFSVHELDIDGERLYQTNTRADVMKRADVFLELMQSMIIMMTSVGIFIFVVVLYQMMKVMIDRASGSIALMKVFGYREDEIRKLFLDANFAVVAVGAAVLIPICKWIMDQLFPSFVENVACGIDLSWAPWLYPVIYLGIIACYLVVRAMLMRAVKRSKPVDALSRNE